MPPPITKSTKSIIATIFTRRSRRRGAPSSSHSSFQASSSLIPRLYSPWRPRCAKPPLPDKIGPALGRGQVVRQRVLVPSFAGSNPAAPAIVLMLEKRLETELLLLIRIKRCNPAVPIHDKIYLCQ